MGAEHDRGRPAAGRDDERDGPVDAARLARLAEAADALAEDLSLDRTLERIVRSAVEVTGARYAALGVLGDDGTIERFVTRGEPEGTAEAIGRYPTGQGLLGLLIRDPRIIRLDDLASHPASVGFPPGHPPMTSFLGAPVRSSGTVYGNLYLTDKPGGFDEADERLVEVLAAQAGAAVHDAMLSQRLRELAVQDERDRISRELHDGVIQTLFSIGMGLESAYDLVRADPDRAMQRIDSAVDGLDEAIRELRNHIFRLRPLTAAALGPVRGLRELAREYEVNALVRPVVDIADDVEVRVPDAWVPDLLQLAREALSNAAKHAGAGQVRISLEVDHELRFEVADDGRGYDPDAQRPGGGTLSMRERAEALGGTLRIDTRPGAGTAVRLRAPLDAAEDHSQKGT